MLIAYSPIGTGGIDDRQNLGGKVPAQKGYHVALPQDVTYDLRSEMCMYMTDWGVEVKYHHPEVGGIRPI